MEGVLLQHAERQLGLDDARWQAFLQSVADVLDDIGIEFGREHRLVSVLAAGG